MDTLGLGTIGRFVLGLGGPQTARPLARLETYLDELDVPADRTLLAALGPKKLEMARRRAAGAIALLVTPDYTAQARAILGDAVLVISQFVVLDTDPDSARRTAREVDRPHTGAGNEDCAARQRTGCEAGPRVRSLRSKGCRVRRSGSNILVRT